MQNTTQCACPAWPPKTELKMTLDSACKESLLNSPGLLDFAMGLVNSVFNLPNGQVKFFKELNLQKNCEINSAHQEVFGAS